MSDLNADEKRILEKGRYIEILIDDFKRHYPDSSQAERYELVQRLKEFSNEDLLLLVSQVVDP